MPIELPPQYDPKSVEKAIYQKWLDAKAFHAVPDERPEGQRFSVVIPPPNVTGALHLGHAINGTIQDVLTRYHRMRGDNSMWMPGIDHAGIATQAVVEKTIFEKEKKSRHDLGREELVRRIWEWKEQFGTRILNQLQSIGASCDWERTRFTLDDICARAVREAFFKMFKDGLIFRGKRLVNWDTHLQTAVADDEIYHEAVKGQMTSIKYPVAHEAQPSEPRPSGSDQSGLHADGSLPDGRGSETEYLVVATTRPETMLGDTAVAVHPDDPRYKHLHGKHVIIPLVGRKIPVITDGLLVDPKFGTGVVKVTPAHDPNDYATGQRHNLEQINLLTPDGKVNENGAGEFLGKKYSYIGLKFATVARKQILEDLESLGLIADKKVHEHEVGHSDRSKTPIEPYLSDQWFVRMGDVSEPRPSGSDPSDASQQKKPHSNAQAYFITFHTFATWLHGQEPGSVDPANNDYGSDFIPPDPKLLDMKIANLKEPPFTLEVPQRQSVLATLREVAAHRGWVIHAANVRATHVHIVVSGDHAPERMMNDFKSYATRRLTEAGLVAAETKVWSRHGSTRYLWKPDHVSAAVHYTLASQGENPSGTAGGSSENSNISARKEAQGSLPDGRGSEGVVLADGTRVSGLAQAAMDAVTSGRVKITPERYAKGYLDWLGQKRDWCISRQLWWGHRIPVWSRRIDLQDERESGVIWASELDKALAFDRSDCVALMVESESRKQLTLADITILNGDGSTTISFRGSVDVYICDLIDNRGWESEGFVRDPDVLDTWFSSALWPISTMGWPGSVRLSHVQSQASLPDGRVSDGQIPEAGLLDYFYPTSVLSTAREILTLWVARMVMFGLYCKGDVPFRDVYIHAIIQDGEGRPMKKHLGNGVDPVDIVQSHGADALRFTLASMATETQDIRLPVQLVCPHCHERIVNNINGPVVIGCPKCKKQLTRPVQTAVGTAEAPMSHSTSDRFDIGRNFANKIWNASRYILSNMGDGDLNHQDTKAPRDGKRVLEDRWILSRLHSTIRSVESAINAYRFADVAEALRSFFWTDLCDWYLEISKGRIRAGDEVVRGVLMECLRTTLKLLHPVMPFITEELWGKIGGNAKQEEMLVTAAWPVFDGSRIDEAAEREIGLVQGVVSQIREIQNSYPAAKGKEAVLVPRDAGTQGILQSSRGVIEGLGNVKVVENSPGAGKPENAAARVLPECQIFIGGVIDKGAETVKLTKRREELKKLIGADEGKLANEAFVSKAPAKIIEGLREQLGKRREELGAVERNLAELG